MEISGLRYLHQRGLTEETIREADLMFFKDGKLYFDKHIRNPKVLGNIKSIFEFKTSKGDYHYRERFDNSILIPVYDAYGSYAATMARRLEPGVRAKFDSTPYEKRYLLYQMNRAALHILEENSVFVVEGIWDALMMRQFGIKNTVAANSCRLSPEQIHLCGRFTNQFNILFDPDKAGKIGAEKTGNEIKKQGYEYRIITLNKPVDLDTYLLSFGVPEEILCLKSQSGSKNTPPLMNCKIDSGTSCR